MGKFVTEFESCFTEILGLQIWNNTHRMQVDQTTPKISYELLLKA